MSNTEGTPGTAAQRFNLTSSFEQALEDWQPGKIILRLFVAGNSLRSQAAIETLHGLCEENFDGDYQLEVVDSYQKPALARQQQIIATPTLVKYLPEPRKVLIGNLSQRERFMACLGLSA